jgi:hypothetical protein
VLVASWHRVEARWWRWWCRCRWERGSCWWSRCHRRGSGGRGVVTDRGEAGSSLSVEEAGLVAACAYIVHSHASV